MEVTVEELGKLKRKLTVEVPLSEVSAAYDRVFSEIRSNVRVDGFRPGRFPRNLAEKRFKALMAQEATQSLVPKYFAEALEDKKLQPATEPQFDNLDIDKKRPFRFDVQFEIVPEFELPENQAFSIEEKEVTLEADAVEERIEQHRKARASLVDKGSEPAEKGDVVKFDFSATIDGDPFPGGNGSDQLAELGDGRFLENFEEQLVGASAGDEKSFDLTFPSDYAEPSLVGKTARFNVTLKKVEKKIPAKLDQEFFSTFAETVKSEEDLHTFVEDQITRERTDALEQQYRDDLADQIRQKVDFDVPESLVERGIADLTHRLSHDDPELLKDEKGFENKKSEETERLIGDMRLTYILNKFSGDHNVEPDSDAVRKRFFLQAYMTRLNPNELIRSQEGRAMLSRIEEDMRHKAALSLWVDMILGREIKAEEKANDGDSGASPGAESEDSASTGGAGLGTPAAADGPASDLGPVTERETTQNDSSGGDEAAR